MDKPVPPPQITVPLGTLHIPQAALDRSRNLGIEAVKEERRSPDIENGQSYQFQEGSPSPSRYLMRSPSPFDEQTRSLTPIPRPAQYTDPEFREKILRERGVWETSKCYIERPSSNSSQSTTDSQTATSSSESTSAESHSSSRASSSHEESSLYATRMPFGHFQNVLPFERFLERHVRIKKEEDQREVRIKTEDDEREVRIKIEEDEREVRIKDSEPLTREPRSTSTNWTRRDEDRPSSTNWTRRDEDRPSSTNWTRKDEDRPSSTNWTRRDEDRPSSSNWTRKDEDRPSSTNWTRRDEDRPNSSSWTRRDEDRPSWTRRDEDRPRWTRRDEELDSDEEEEEEDEVPKQRGLEFSCEVCEIQVSSMQGLQDHFAGARHQKKLRASGLTSDLTELGKDIYTTADPTLKKRILRCKLCDVIFSGSEMAVHVNATKHKSALDEFEEPPHKADPFWFEDIGLSDKALQQQEQDREGYYCDLCGCTLPSRELFQKHLQGKKHQKRLKWTEGEDLPEGGQQFWCQICNIFCTNQESLDAHLAGKKHAKVLKSKGLVDQEEPPAQPTAHENKRQQPHVSQYLPPQPNSRASRWSPSRRSRSPTRRSRTPSRRSRSPPKYYRSSSRHSRSPPRYLRNPRRSRSPPRSVRSPPRSLRRHSRSPPRASHRLKDINPSQGSTILGGITAHNLRMQCTLCKIMLYSNSEIHDHLASAEHIDAIMRNPHLKLQDVLVSESAMNKKR